MILAAQGGPGPPGAAPPASPAGSFVHTPRMHRWLGIVALFLRLAGDGYRWTARPRDVVPISRAVRPAARGTELTPDWWRP